MGLSSSKTRPGDLMALGIEFAPRVGASSRSQLHEFLVFDGAFGANGLGGGGRDGARCSSVVSARSSVVFFVLRPWWPWPGLQPGEGCPGRLIQMNSEGPRSWTLTQWPWRQRMTNHNAILITYIAKMFVVWI